jgi:diguanylate cyclase (GGDEF)-like protein
MAKPRGAILSLALENGMERATTAADAGLSEDALHGSTLIIQATRELLRIKTRADAKRIAEDVVRGLGGRIILADEADDEALPVDLSFGEGAPVVPTAPVDSVARMLLDRHLPSLVEDIRRAVELAYQVERFAEDASIDSLTGVANRRMLGRALGRLGVGDVVVMIDLDHFKDINDRLGHDAGDGVLRAFGRTLGTAVRGRDMVGRYGGEEFVVILADDSDADAFLRRFRAAWEIARPHPVTFSAGIAPVGALPGSTLEAADRAMYRAKAAGRDGWMLTAEIDQASRPADVAGVADHPVSAFVAFSALEVPDGGQEQVEAAFRDRLGSVDGWPGFHALEVWADVQDPHAYVMVSWWETASAFQAYMRSDDHRRSHGRISTGNDRPRPKRFRRYRVVAR